MSDLCAFPVLDVPTVKKLIAFTSLLLELFLKKKS